MSLKQSLDAAREILPDGEDYYCHQVPEELHFWTRSHKWKSMVGPYKVRPVRIKVKGVSRDATSQVIRYTKRKPKMVCGVEVRGQKTISQSVTHTWDFRVDGAGEINEILEDLCSEDGVEEVRVLELDVYAPDQGVEMRSIVYNPDGNGQALYIVKYITDDEEKLYPEIALSNLNKFTGRFRGNMAQCSMIPLEGREPACVIKKRIKKRQVKRVKNRNK